MTAHVSTILSCDHNPACPARFAADGWPSVTRAQARTAGWDITTGDRCPEHPPGGAPPPPALFDLADMEAR